MRISSPMTAAALALLAGLLLHGCKANPCDGVRCPAGTHCEGGACVSMDAGVDVSDDAPPDGAGTGCTTHDDCRGDDPCLGYQCSPVTHTCEAFPLADGTRCGDDMFCNGDEICLEGLCTTETSPCEDDECTTAVCDEVLDKCVRTSRPDGTGCDDGSWCTGVDACQAGECVGSAPCPVTTGNRCTRHVCNEEADSCDEVSVEDGQTCADRDPCNGDETCQAGVCTAGAPPCDDGDPATEDFCEVDGTGSVVCSHV